MIYLSVGFRASIDRSDEGVHIRSLDLRVVTDLDSGREVELGRYGADLLLLDDILNDGENLLDVCDADSQGWYDVHHALFDNGDFREELGIDEATSYVLFLWDSVLHPKLSPYRQGILEAIGNLFGHQTLVAMWRYVTDLTNAELHQLGFAKVAGTKLVCRHMALVSEFTNSNPLGVEVPLEFEATRADEEWVLARWKKKHPHRFPQTEVEDSESD